jgi:predicted Ser/Thr protein kinase
MPTVNLSAGAAGPRQHSHPRDDARFLPGAILDGRYRIVSLLGKGGMGEVYRADDLKLGQPVALKFLPPGLEEEPERLRRFLDEVRIARQVSHANVCRVYDAGETQGQHFLSMEYVDGEDLGSLLRRIGRIPKDKAIEIARQLCAGLAAAHEVGVLHRDLKPANVMIDGRGRARVTDFGLAALAGDIGGEDVRSGTPAYMAPEQLAGREVTVRSDLYALGLVLYELFTGKTAFKAASFEERRRLQKESTPSSPSHLVEGFDPAVERVILRCLEEDPARRPSSALSIAAALPGGDPIAAALAAGETPSPQMVAEAGDREVPPALSWGALALFLTTLAGGLALASRMGLVGMVPLEKPPEFLRERAREILALAGHDQRTADSLFAFRTNEDYFDDLRRREGEGDGRWEKLRASPPSGIHFWYRQSPQQLAPLAGAVLGHEMEDPPSVAPGMARVELDPEGRLISLSVVPGERATQPPAVDLDWDPLLRATGVDAGTVSPVAPEWAPPVFAERRAAWTASWAGRAEVPLRIEAAAAGGRPVFLRVIEPWTRPAEAPAPPEGLWRTASQFTNTITFIVVIVAAALVALRNVRRGRGDRRGALRLALYLGAMRMVWYLGAHHVASPKELEIFIAHLSYAMQRVGLAYVMYLAVEPYARRLWPRMLVSWVRALDGRFRDPLVGRDLLVGCAGAALSVLLSRLSAWTIAALGGSYELPSTSFWTYVALRGPVSALVAIVGIHTSELLSVMIPVTLLVIVRLLLRRNDLAVVVVSLVGLVIVYPGTGNITAYVLGFFCSVIIAWIALFRFGLLALATMTTVATLIEQMPLTLHPEGWYLGAMIMGLVAVATPALWGFWTSQAGRPLFRDTILEPAAPC